VHRDIKPTNIMVSLEEGGAVTAKIIDLGLAKTVHERGSQTAISTAGGFAGTPEFASPEPFRGSTQAVVRVDEEFAHFREGRPPCRPIFCLVCKDVRKFAPGADPWEFC